VDKQCVDSLYSLVAENGKVKLATFCGDYNIPSLSSVGLVWAMYTDTCARKAPPFALVPCVCHPLLLLDVAIDCGHRLVTPWN